MPTPLERLRTLLAHIPECSTVRPIDCRLGFPAFFPGGPGFAGKTFPKSGVMLVGNNFGTIKEYEDACDFGQEFRPGSTKRNDNKTWYDLWNFYLADADLGDDSINAVPINRCFFTNVYLGAIPTDPKKEAAGRKTSNRGRFKASMEYSNACVAALKEQIAIAEPLVIALLGAHVPEPFGRALPSYLE